MKILIKILLFKYQRSKYIYINCFYFLFSLLHMKIFICKNIYIYIDIVNILFIMIYNVLITIFNIFFLFNNFTEKIIHYFNYESISKYYLKKNNVFS